MAEPLTLKQGLDKLETIMRVQRESLLKLKGATDLEYVVDNLLDSQLEIYNAIESLVVALQRLTT